MVVENPYAKKRPRATEAPRPASHQPAPSFHAPTLQEQQCTLPVGSFPYSSASSTASSQSPVKRIRTQETSRSSHHSGAPAQQRERMSQHLTQRSSQMSNINPSAEPLPNSQSLNNINPHSYQSSKQHTSMSKVNPYANKSSPSIQSSSRINPYAKASPTQQPSSQSKPHINPHAKSSSSTQVSSPKRLNLASGRPPNPYASQKPPRNPYASASRPHSSQPVSKPQQQPSPSNAYPKPPSRTQSLQQSSRRPLSPAKRPQGAQGAGVMSTSSASQQQSKPSPSNPYPKSKVELPTKKAQEIMSTPPTSNAQPFDNDMSFDDGGIDWEIAAEQVDAATKQRNNILAQNLSAKSSQDPAKKKQKSPPKAVSDPKQMIMKPTPPGAKQAALTLERPTQWSNPQSRPSSSSSVQQQHQVPRILQYDKERTKPVADDLRAQLVKNARLSEPLDNGWSLFSHQKKAVLRALLMRRIILALDMGLGKTLIGCIWARAFQATYGDGLKVFCVSPVTLIKQWRRTAEESTGIVLQDQKQKPDPDSLLMEFCSWAKVPDKVGSSIQQYVVICDEAHSMQSMDAGRTKAVLKLVKSPRCVGVLLLTGTPMKNGKPSNLFPLLKAVKHPFGDNQKEYERYFCDGREKSFGRGKKVWDANGCSNLGELREHIESHLLHMTKEECLAKLPPQTRVIREVPVSSKFRLQHDQALAQLASIYAARGTLGDSSGDAVLTAVGRVKRIAACAKIDATVAIAKDVLQKEPAVVIFTGSVDAAKGLHQKLAASGWEGELLTGETKASLRQGMVDKFQEGVSPVIVCTYGVGGVGMTMTAAHTIILMDRPWTPGDTRQAEDRVRRIGQTKPVTSIWMVAFDFDRQIDAILQQKTNTTDAVLTGDGPGSSGAPPKLSVMKMLSSLLSPGQTTLTGYVKSTPPTTCRYG